jgi:hypothetical protein
MMLSEYATAGVTTGQGWTAAVRFPAGSGVFSILHSVQTSSVAHPDPYAVCTGSSFSGGKSDGT